MRPGPLGGCRTIRKVQLLESHETHIYLPGGHKRLKQYLHEVSPVCQAYSDKNQNKLRPLISVPFQLSYPR
jgi:hypothetical protein